MSDCWVKYPEKAPHWFKGNRSVESVVIARDEKKDKDVALTSTKTVMPMTNEGFAIDKDL